MYKEGKVWRNGSQSLLGIKGFNKCHTLKLGNEENVKNPLTKKQQNAVFIFKHNNLNLKMETKKILQKNCFPLCFVTRNPLTPRSNL